MAPPVYAVIAYLPGRLGRFVDELRDQVNPEYASALAHVTVLPPRPLISPPEELLAGIRRTCARREPMDVAAERVETFWPANSVVYLSLGAGYEQLAELHRELNVADLRYAEPYPFVPHITIAQNLDEQGTASALEAASRAWEQYQGERSFRIETLCLVVQGQGHSWINIAPIPLSSFFYSSQTLKMT